MNAENQTPKITRVDMKEYSRGVLVSQFEDGWTARTSAIEIHRNTTISLSEMVTWFKDHGWQVHQWKGGARAWLGPVLPVRSMWQIISLRQELHSQLILAGGHHPLGELHALDLAVDL